MYTLKELLVLGIGAGIGWRLAMWAISEPNDLMRAFLLFCYVHYGWFGGPMRPMALRSFGLVDCEACRETHEAGFLCPQLVRRFGEIDRNIRVPMPYPPPPPPPRPPPFPPDDGAPS